MALDNENGGAVTDPMSYPSFPKFSDLPLELRLAIWDCTRPRRILEITTYLMSREESMRGGRLSGQGAHITRPLRVPAAAQSCSEARYKLLGSKDLPQDCYRVLSLERESGPLYLTISPELWGFIGIDIPHKIYRNSWFDTECDMLYWNMPDLHVNDWDDELRTSVQALSVKHLMLPYLWIGDILQSKLDANSGIREACMKSAAAIFTGLERVSFVAGGLDLDVPRAESNDSSSPQNYVLIDINDRNEMEKVESLINSLPKSTKTSRHRQQWDRIRQRRELPMKWGLSTWCADFLELWCSAGENWEDVKSLCQGLWEEVRRGGEHLGTVPRFQEMLVLRVHGVSPGSLGFNSDVFEIEI
ncbi:hypothetical protein F5X99DRAFT_365283 [Biscogniauxia marginata]|nr:hypothetical protein F5X99DRAFT_365283 [Biscogniauxia marginata]